MTPTSRCLGLPRSWGHALRISARRRGSARLSEISDNLAPSARVPAAGKQVLAEERLRTEKSRCAGRAMSDPALQVPSGWRRGVVKQSVHGRRRQSSTGGDAVFRGGDRELCAQPRAGARSAVEDDSAAQRLDAVLEADQAGAVAEVSPADAVVADCDTQDVVFGVGFDSDADGRGVRVLGRVGQRLGDDIVARDLDRLGQPIPRVARLGAGAPLSLGDCDSRARRHHHR